MYYQQKKKYSYLFEKKDFESYSKSDFQKELINTFFKCSPKITIRKCLYMFTNSNSKH